MGFPSRPSASSRARLSTAAALLLLLTVVSATAKTAFAHTSQSSVFSKFEATTSGQAIAVVFALDTTAVLRELQKDASAKVDRTNVDGYGDLFGRFLFPRFSISNDGQPCEHPPELARFFWDSSGDHVIAVTKFECASKLGELVIRSVVTRDMPLPHELVGDLRYGHALVRNFFTPRDPEQRVSLSSLAQAGPAAAIGFDHDAGAHVNARIPPQERLYESLASQTLGIDLPADPPADVRPTATFGHFVGEGIAHIFSGYDHIAFIATLVLAVATWRQLAWIVTSFTAAHSLTLALATFGLVTLPTRYVEPLIALTVLIVAVDALARPHAQARMAMAFGFGLVHGLGLSNVLRDLGLSGRDLVPALFGFNVGVELGQLAIVAPLFVAIVHLRKKETVYARSRSAVCGLVAVAAAIWFVTRVRDGFFT